MSEVADTGSHFVTFAILAFYWALLSLWPEILLHRDNAAQTAVPLAEDTKSAQSGSPLALAFDAIRAIEQTFDEAAFLSGRSKAYEMILRAYADADMKTLKRLLGAAALADFDRAIKDRLQAGETLDLTFVGIKEAAIVEANLDGSAAEITVRFIAEIISVTRAADGRLLAGDPQRIVEAHELWTFGRDLKSRGRDWRLVASEEGE